LSAFYELSNGEPISWRDRIDYARWKGLDYDVANAFCFIIRALDNEYQIWRAEKQKVKEGTIKNGRSRI
jgi:hypothetical protein